MAFPGTYNISYYRGDTLEFRIYPKDANGNTFSLNGYGDAKFWIQPSRGNVADSTRKRCSVSIVDNTYVLCAITPEKGLELTAGTTYYYDVEITKTGGTYPLTHTLLTGTVAVTEHVSGTSNA